MAIGKFKFNNDHRYLIVDGSDASDSANYELPIDDPDYNIKSDFRRYRQIAGFLRPEEIKRNRKQLGLNLRETSAILGISYSTLSEIENGLILHSVIQDNLLRMMTNTNVLVDLFKQHETYIRQTFGKDVCTRIADKLKSTR